MAYTIAPSFHALRTALLGLLLCLLPALSFASACTAMWAILGDGTNNRLAWYNNSAGTAAKWTTLSFQITQGLANTGPNALAGDPNTGLLYYFDRGDLELHSVNINTYADINLGVVPGSPAATTNTNMIGATTDASGTLWLMASSGGGNAQYYITSINKTAPIVTLTSWTQITYLAGGGQPFSGGSGDLFVDNGNQAYLATNTNPPAIYPLTLATAKVGPSVTYALGNLSALAGIALNPANGRIYMSSSNTGSITYQVNPSVSNQSTLTDASSSTGYQVSDMGNCIVAPNPPTISKSFSPNYSALSGSSTTLAIAIGNSNTTPLWLDAPLNDVLPAGMTIAATPNLTTGACASSSTVTNVITAPAGGGTVTFASGGRVPAGGCTITLSVTAAASASAYTNTIPAGSLSTTAGSNASAATATYKVGTDFAVQKSQRLGDTGPTTTSVITVPGNATYQYILNINNSTSGGTGSLTFTDTLPVQATPLLTLTAVIVAGFGGGTCTATSAPVGGATQITGTMTASTPGT